jgi:citrate lyase subunit beta / citryl-CoA lyase
MPATRKSSSVLHEVFTPSRRELDWARQVVDAFDAAGGEALRLPDGEFVDLPVAERARRLLELAGGLSTIVGGR